MTGESLRPLSPDAVPVLNAWYLLLYAWDLVRWRGRWDGAASQAPNLLGLLARVIADCTKDLLRHPLARSYEKTTGAIPGIRGRIDFARSANRFSFLAGRAVCTYTEQSIDTLKNRILKSTLNRLLHHPLIEPGAAPDVTTVLRHELRQCVRAMDGVAIVPVQGAHFSTLQLARNDRGYILPLAICYLIYRFEMPTEQSGHSVLGGLLRDQIVFGRLFERFVRNFYRHHRPDLRVSSEDLSWFDELGSHFVPRMRTDITLEWGEPVNRRMVIDTKYYYNALSARFESSEKFHAANLYQLYAYLRTQEHRSPAHRNAAGLLLYPTTKQQLDERMRVQGHDIRVATVDLAAPWPGIEAELLDIVAKSQSVPGLAQ